MRRLYGKFVLLPSVVMFCFFARAEELRRDVYVKEMKREVDSSIYVRSYVISRDSRGELGVQVFFAPSSNLKEIDGIKFMRDPKPIDFSKIEKNETLEKIAPQAENTQSHQVTYQESIIDFDGLGVTGRLTKPRVRFQQAQPIPDYTHFEPKLGFTNRVFDDAALYQQLIESRP